LTLCLIIGGFGQDGYYLARAALENGMQVVLTTRNLNSYTHDDFDLSDPLLIKIQADPNDPQVIIKILQSYKPSMIFNLAAQSSVGRSFAKPLETYTSCLMPNLNLLDALKNTSRDTIYIHATSADCFGGNDYPGGLNLPRANPRSPYGAAKHMASQLVSQYRNHFGISAVNGYLYNHESIRRGPNFVLPKIFKTAFDVSNGKDVKLRLGNIDIIRDWGCADEYMRGLLEYAQSEHPTDFILATGVGMTLRSVVERVFTNYDLDYKEFLIIEETHKRPTDIDTIVGTNEFLKCKIGWEPSLTGLKLIDKLHLDYDTLFRK
jgi:GDPmannose 4,6-dehydratase